MLHVNGRDTAGQHAPGRNDLVSRANTGYRTLGGAWCDGRLLHRYHDSYLQILHTHCHQS